MEADRPMDNQKKIQIKLHEKVETIRIYHHLQRTGETVTAQSSNINVGDSTLIWATSKSQYKKKKEFVTGKAPTTNNDCPNHGPETAPTSIIRSKKTLHRIGRRGLRTRHSSMYTIYLLYNIYYLYSFNVPLSLNQWSHIKSTKIFSRSPTPST